MQLIISHLRIPIEEDGMAAYLRAATSRLGVDHGVTIVKILSKALDLRDQQQFYYKVELVVEVADGFAGSREFPLYQEPAPLHRQVCRSQERPMVVGFGPAGMFAALELIAYGLKPLIFERGKKIEERHLDVQRFINDGYLNPESNIQFGEGGAGSYSDGKLFSRRNNNTGYVNRVLQTFIKFGAPPEIGYISKPHLGTDLLCRIVGNIRNYILERGGVIHYSARMTDLLLADGRVAGIVINGEQEFCSRHLYLALGHSARETFAMLHEKGVALEQRPISVGVRIEHPAETINLIRYGEKYKDCRYLGAATYSFNYTNQRIKRGVYTFCMCPGGEVVNASSEQGGLVLNGMSYSRRASFFSNAALVVNCHVDDYGSPHPLAGLDFQRKIEEKAFVAGGGTWQAPAENLSHFLGDRDAAALPENSFQMGVTAASMDDIFPGFVVRQLRTAFAKWQEEAPLFVSRQAILLGAETRTSSPVRISRNERYESVNTRGLYPIGEGSGYTGGITSSAADAIRAVEKQVAA
ncbi:MAG: dehydrogenase [Desulfobulbaceae bacterium]|nr:MAG: dehydrogenase [Desulfobulbaceae bacterium]